MGCSCGKSKKEIEIDATDEKIEANGKKTKQPKEKKVSGTKPDEKSAQESNDSSKNGKKSPSRNGSAKSVHKPSGVISTAKVRPLTPKVAPQNVPKPVAFEIELNQNGDKENTEVTELSSTANGGISKMPRKLPKLTSLNKNADENKLNEDALLNKQKKAEENRLEILESKKQKARKFLIKFGSSSINDNGADDNGRDSQDANTEADATNNKETENTNNNTDDNMLTDVSNAVDQNESGTSGDETTVSKLADNPENKDNSNVIGDGSNE